MFVKPILGDHTQGKKHLYITRHIPHIQEPLNIFFLNRSLLKQVRLYSNKALKSKEHGVSLDHPSPNASFFYKSLDHSSDH